MSRIVPYPFLAGLLLVLWLLLQQSMSAGHLLLGSIVALVTCHATAPLQPETPPAPRGGLRCGASAAVAPGAAGRPGRGGSSGREETVVCAATAQALKFSGSAVRSHGSRARRAKPPGGLPATLQAVIGALGEG